MEKQMMNAVKMAVVFGLVSFCGMSAPRLAAGDEGGMGGIKPLVAVDLGFGAYNNGVGTKFAYGLRGGARMGDLEAGIGYRKSKLSSDDAASTSVDIEYLLGEFDYAMAAGPGRFTVGVLIGQAKVSANLNLGLVTLEGDSETKFAVGPKVGYQYPLSEHFELGAALDYVTVFTDDKTTSLGFLANATYVF